MLNSEENLIKDLRLEIMYEIESSVIIMEWQCCKKLLIETEETIY